MASHRPGWVVEFETIMETLRHHDPTDRQFQKTIFETLKAMCPKIVMVPGKPAILPRPVSFFKLFDNLATCCAAMAGIQYVSPFPQGEPANIDVNWFHVLLLCEEHQTVAGNDIWAELVKLPVAGLSPTTEPAALGRPSQVTHELSLAPEQDHPHAQSDNAVPAENTSVRHSSSSRVGSATHARGVNEGKQNCGLFKGDGAHSSVTTGDNRGESPQSFVALWPAIPAFKNVVPKADAPAAEAKPDLLISLEDDSAVGNGAGAVGCSFSQNFDLLQGLQSGFADPAETVQQQQPSPQRRQPTIEPDSDLRLFKRSRMSMLERKLHDAWSLRSWARFLSDAFNIQPFTIPLPCQIDVKYLDADKIHAVPELEVLLDVEQLPINLRVKPRNELCEAYDNATREDDLERGGFADGGDGVVQAAINLYALILQWISSYCRSCRCNLNAEPHMLSVFLSEVYSSGDIERRSAAELDVMHSTSSKDFIDQAMNDVLPIAREEQAPVLSEGLELPKTGNVQLCTNATNQGRDEDSERPVRDVFGKFVRAARGPRWARSQQRIAHGAPQASNRKADYW